jgi:DNA-binding transcriptional MerR regulator
VDGKDLLPIGEVAARSGFSTSALRFYEKEGCSRRPGPAGGQRRYPRSVLRRLAFVRAASNVGLSLEEVRRRSRRCRPGARRARPTGAACRSPGGAARRADHRPGGPPGRPEQLHRLRLPVTALVPAVQPRRRGAGAGHGGPLPGALAAPAQRLALRGLEQRALGHHPGVPAEPRERALEPVLEADLGLPAEPGAGQRDVGLADRRVVDRAVDEARSRCSSPVSALIVSARWSTETSCGLPMFTGPRGRCAAGRARPVMRSST